MEIHGNVQFQIHEGMFMLGHWAFSGTVGLINIAAKFPVPALLGEGLSIVSSKEW